MLLSIVAVKLGPDWGLTVLATLHEVDHAAGPRGRIYSMARGRVRREELVDSLMS